MIWTITCSPSSTGTPTSHDMSLVYEAIKVRMNILLLPVIIIFTCYQSSQFSFVGTFFCCCTCWCLSRVNLVRFWLTVSFGRLPCRWWTFGRLCLVHPVLVGRDAGAAYGAADCCGSGSWRGEVELEVAKKDGPWLPDLDMLSLFFSIPRLVRY
jgi:hypothetical protein